jgi:hypothetical protein
VSTVIGLPSGEGGTWQRVELREPRNWERHPEPFTTRVAFAAAHVVPRALGDNVPGAPADIDWDTTLAFRRRLFAYGLGVAEAMDTAQRNMGLDWPAAHELIRRSAAQARECGARITSGAGTDHRPDVRSLEEVVAAYQEQVGAVEDAGSQVVVMASRQLARVATTPDDYLKVYDTVLSQVREPVILHWLGAAFDPELAGYWGSHDTDAATATFLDLLAGHANRIDGVKVSLLSAEHEVALRAALPAGVRLYTGDDLNYPELIRGDGRHHSDALLGTFAAIAPAASAALAALDRDDLAGYDAEMSPTLALSRHLFSAPTYYYKTGIAFLAWVSGLQPGFTMVGGLQAARSIPHLARLLALANDARLLPDPELAGHRMRLLLDCAGAQR